MSETLVRIANNSLMLRVNILFDMLTALGVIFSIDALHHAAQAE